VDSKGMPAQRLVEAIFEARWQLPDFGDGSPPKDPLYKLAVGSLFENLKSEYPFHRQLPASVLPDEISAYIIQHQFRTADDSWPLVQLGQGILTVNDTREKYNWGDFQSRIKSAMKHITCFYEENGQPIVTKLQSLTYVNSVPFDFLSQDGLRYLEERMGIAVGLDGSLMASCADKRPSGFDLHFVYQTSSPHSSELRLRFGTATSADGARLISWETAVRSEKEGDISGEEQISDWAQEAHKVAKQVYLALVSKSTED
jgi:uncharacterized protein (TIGR04255 family)